jgi:hypothetical protein
MGVLPGLLARFLLGCKSAGPGRTLRAAACLAAGGLLLPLATTPATAQTDLSVGWIARLPRIPYVWQSPRPHVVGWPTPGKPVTWVAHVRNLGDERLRGVRYRWLLDGTVVATGQVELRPRSLVQVSLRRPWRRVRQELVFEIDADQAIAESEERNNRLLVHTDALGVGLWVERSFWEGMRPVVARAGMGAGTFDDWMQRRIRQFNEMAALAVSPDTPRGALDRWRIDAIHVVPDGKLPVSAVGPEVRDWGADPGAYPVLYPHSKDRTIDMQWGFPASSLPFYAGGDPWTLNYDSFVHELGHARYLIDVYAANLSLPGDVVDITPAPPGGWLHFTREYGMMNTSWGYLDRHSVGALNRIAGRRATRGHYNEPSNIGEYLNDLPAENRVRLVTASGQTFPHRRVEIFRPTDERDGDWLEHPYRLSFDATPDLVLETDAEGAVLVGRNPFADAAPFIGVDRNTSLAIVRLIDGATSHWGYLEVFALNLAFWRGDTHFAEHELVLDEPACFGAGLGPNVVTPGHWALVEGPEVTFSWPTEIARGGFELWWSADGGEPQHVEVARPLSSTTRVTLPFDARHVAWWLRYRRSSGPAECPQIQTAIYFFDLE